MEQADVPVLTDGVQEAQQRARSFRELEAEQPLMLEAVPTATPVSTTPTVAGSRALMPWSKPRMASASAKAPISLPST
jgi:hypothetical protein